MMGCEIVSGETGNPMSLVFYCFLPAALWMITQEQKHDAQKVYGLKDRIDQLEKARCAAALPKAG